MNTENRQGRAVGLYVHVPFCFSKCSYCGFYSILPDAQKVEAFLQRLEIEAEARLAPIAETVQTVFVGGGNPMCLGLSGIMRLTEIISRHLAPSAIREWTFEANPENFSDEIAAFCSEVPAIRISLGAQRLQDPQLRILGRKAVLADVCRAAEICNKYLFNYSIDLILGVPDCPSISQDLPDFIHRFSPAHISAYFLTLEPGTVLNAKVEQNEFADPADADPEELFAVKEILASCGYEHYEISNYAKPGRRCLHNLNYWEPADYLGLGPAAVSSCAEVRSYNPADFSRWVSGADFFCERLSPSDRRNEYVMLRLRLLADGLNLQKLEEGFGPQDSAFFGEISRHINEGNLVSSGDTVKLSAKGILFSDNIISSLFL